MATERKIPIITVKAFSVFIKSAILKPVSSEANLIKAIIQEAPNNSKTIETVVEVGNPNVLKISNKITSLITTERKMHITSRK